MPPEELMPQGHPVAAESVVDGGVDNNNNAPSLVITAENCTTSSSMSLTDILEDYVVTSGCSKEDLVAALKIHVDRLEKELITAKAKANTNSTSSLAMATDDATKNNNNKNNNNNKQDSFIKMMMYASPNHDPGLQCRFNGDFEKELQQKMSEKMTNLKKVKNEGQVVSNYMDHPA